MGSKTDGLVAEHLKSKCCSANVRFEYKTTSLYAWCENCGNYIHTRPVQSLIALYMGDFAAVMNWNGFLPDWLAKFRAKEAIITEFKSKLFSIFKTNTTFDVKRIIDELNKIEAKYNGT